MKSTQTSDGELKMEMSIPLLDIRTWHESPEVFASDLRKACHSIGFFLLKHDISLSIMERQLQETRRFFQLPRDQKLTISYENSPSFRGYMDLGLENTNGKTDWREQLELSSEANWISLPGKQSYQEGGDHKEQQTDHLPLHERLRGTNQWPDDIQPTLKESTITYVDEILLLGKELRRAVSVSLGLDKNELEPMFTVGTGQPHWALKLSAYPPVHQHKDKERSKGEQSFGVGPHTDTNFMTFVLQDDVGGLQVFSRGRWIDVPVGGRDDDNGGESGNSILVCNLGEQAEILSNGYFCATPHRVLTNRSNKTRISVPLFYNPPLEAVVKPLQIPRVLPWERNGSNDEIRHQSWRLSRNKMLNTVGDNTFKSLARSHPNNFARYHGDLVVLGDGTIVKKEQD